MSLGGIAPVLSEHIERDALQKFSFVSLMAAAGAYLAPNATASMHRDLRSGKQSEVDGLVFEVVRLGEKYGVDTPVYRTMAEKFA